MALQAVELRVRLQPRVAAELLLALDPLEAVADGLEALLVARLRAVAIEPARGRERPYFGIVTGGVK